MCVCVGGGGGGGAERVKGGHKCFGVVGCHL